MLLNTDIDIELVIFKNAYPHMEVYKTDHDQMQYFSVIVKFLHKGPSIMITDETLRILGLSEKPDTMILLNSLCKMRNQHVSIQNYHDGYDLHIFTVPIIYLPNPENVYDMIPCKPKPSGLLNRILNGF